MNRTMAMLVIVLLMIGVNLYMGMRVLETMKSTLDRLPYKEEIDRE